jgi:hypothetical protein
MHKGQRHPSPGIPGIPALEMALIKKMPDPSRGLLQADVASLGFLKIVVNDFCCRSWRVPWMLSESGFV